MQRASRFEKIRLASGFFNLQYNTSKLNTVRIQTDRLKVWKAAKQSGTDRP